MTTPTTPEQARAMARLCFSDNRSALWSLADQVEALTKERDEYAKAADTMAMQHKVERDALMAAAKLALDALQAVLHDCDDIDMVESSEPGRDVGPWQLSNEAITALRQAGVQ